MEHITVQMVRTANDLREDGTPKRFVQFNELDNKRQYVGSIWLRRDLVGDLQNITLTLSPSTKPSTIAMVKDMAAHPTPRKGQVKAHKPASPDESVPAPLEPIMAQVRALMGELERLGLLKEGK